MTKKFYLFVLTALLLVLMVGVVSAQAPVDEGPAPCAGDAVSGTVISIDEETGVAIILTDSGECTASFGGEYKHPIVALFDQYFGTINSQDISQALDSALGYAIYDETTESWELTEKDTAGAEPARIISVVDEGDGLFTVTFITGEGETQTAVISDAELAQQLQEKLKNLDVEWKLITGADGNVTVEDIGDQIAAYHRAGMGFGQLVKLMSIAQETQDACAGQEDNEGYACALTLDELVQKVQSGVGFGQIFKEYGKPAMMGVGHIRQELRDNANNASADNPGTVIGKGNNGKGNAYGLENGNNGKGNKDNKGKKNK